MCLAVAFFEFSLSVSLEHHVFADTERFFLRFAMSRSQQLPNVKGFGTGSRQDQS